jgi:hypothetical protein
MEKTSFSIIRKYIRKYIKNTARLRRDYETVYKCSSATIWFPISRLNYLVGGRKNNQLTKYAFYALVDRQASRVIKGH